MTSNKLLYTIYQTAFSEHMTALQLETNVQMCALQTLHFVHLANTKTTENYFLHQKWAKTTIKT